jgi:hypothetical protein
MKIKAKLELSADQLISNFKQKLTFIGSVTASSLYDRGRQLASQSFGRSGFAKWSAGYKFSKIDDGIYVISVEGKLANMMEDGIKTGEISKMIMEGPRARHNKGENKNYVDVPIGKDADSSGNISIQGQKLQVQSFRSADDLMAAFSKPEKKQVKFSARPGVVEEERIVQRARAVEGLIRSQKPNSTHTSYMVLRRVTEDSIWPSSPYEGQDILGKLDLEIEKTFDTIVERLIGE